MNNLENAHILDEIIAREWKMFQATPNEGGVASCQQRPETFRMMRRMAHSVHGPEFLKSYLDDLREAESVGRNLMLEKYARMDNLIPPISESPLLDYISNQEADFMDEAARKYPDRIRNDDRHKFKNYLRSELETLSPKSLELYAAELKNAVAEGRNPVCERHEWLIEQIRDAR